MLARQVMGVPRSSVLQCRCSSQKTFSEKGLVVGGWQTSNPAPLKGKTQFRKDCKLLGYPQKKRGPFLGLSLFFMQNTFW